MVIRLANPGDLMAVKACAADSYELYIERIGKKLAPMTADFKKQIEAGCVYIATSKAGDLQGFILFFPLDGRMFLENVAVFSKHRGRGVGKRLIAFCENKARRLGLEAVELYTNEKMTENLSLYPRLGFEETDRRTQDGFNRVFFQKRLL